MSALRATTAIFPLVGAPPIYIGAGSWARLLRYILLRIFIGQPLGPTATTHAFVGGPLSATAAIHPFADFYRAALGRNCYDTCFCRRALGRDCCDTFFCRRALGRDCRDTSFYRRALRRSRTTIKLVLVKNLKHASFRLGLHSRSSGLTVLFAV